MDSQCTFYVIHFTKEIGSSLFYEFDFDPYFFLLYIRFFGLFSWYCYGDDAIKY